MRRISTILVAGLALIATAGQAAAAEFPRPPGIEPAVRFWTRVYTQVSTEGGLLHDRNNLAVVYEKIALEGRTRHQHQRQVDARKAHYRQVLREIARKDRSELDDEEQRVLALWPEGVSDARLRAAANDIRFQLGQSDKFRAGLKRSGKWEPHIRRTLEEMGLPEELAALPHVESSFNPDAWSRLGAAGIWQFTRLTGKRYMRIDHVIDERMDPFKSSVAAARLLEHNYSITDNWALAITAYNHGLAGIRRAARNVGSENIATIIERYQGRNWGFASRNFYPAFLAAVEVDFHANKYFGLLEREDTLVSETIELPFYAPVDALVDAFDVSRERLRELNRALRDPIWSGDKRVPRGYALRVPAGPERPPARQLLARVDESDRYFAQLEDRYHRVRSGETLSTIAARYDVAPSTIASLNNLRSQNFIRAGQTLRLPGAGEPGSGDRRFYTVRSGDTLSGIAQRFGLGVSSLAAANGLGDAHRIHPGQELRVDGRAAEEVRTLAKADTDASATETETASSAAADTAADEAASTASTDAESSASGDSAQAAESAESAAAGGSDEESARVAEAEAEAEADTSSTDDSAAADTETDASADADTTGEAASDETGTLASMETDERPTPTLSADPADYSVAADGSIEVQAAETLGHYAEWLDLRASQLRDINNMRYGQPVVVGKRLDLRFSRVAPDTFENRRQAYHQEIQARFFEQFRITGTRRAEVQSGDSLWTIARRTDNVPVWLLRQYNPDLDFEDLHPGMTVTLPTVERQASATAGEGEGGDSATQAESGNTSGGA